MKTRPRQSRWQLSLRLGRMLLMIALATAPVFGASSEPPHIERRGSVLHLRAPPLLLDSDSIGPHLDSGLTTTFVFAVKVRDGERHTAEGVLVVEVRYEAWDEVYRVVAGGPAGSLAPTTLASRDELTAWWRELVLPVVEAADLTSEATWRVTIDLTVHPYSTFERDEARGWFIGSIEPAADATSEALEAAAGERHGALTGLVKGFLASSIRRDAIHVERWRLPLAAGASR